jgi:hypothetical protein
MATSSCARRSPACAPGNRGTGCPDRRFPSRCVKLLSCPAGARVVSSLSLREAFCCLVGFERSLGLRIERSPPTRLRVRPSRHRPACGPSLFPFLARDARSGPAFPPAGLAARFPHAPAPWLLSPAGRISPPPPLASETIERSWHRMLGFYVSSRRVGGFESPSGYQRSCFPRPRGPGVRTRDGVSVIPRSGRHRGAPARDALLGRGRGSLGARRSRLQRESKRRGAAHPLGKTKPSGSDRRRQHRESSTWRGRGSGGREPGSSWPSRCRGPRPPG